MEKEDLENLVGFMQLIINPRPVSQVRGEAPQFAGNPRKKAAEPIIQHEIVLVDSDTEVNQSVFQVHLIPEAGISKCPASDENMGWGCSCDKCPLKQ